MKDAASRWLRSWGSNVSRWVADKVSKAVDAAWPLYGEAQFDPPMTPEEGLKDGVAVEPALLGRLGLQVGDKLHLGDTEVPIVATIVREPDRLGGFVNIGPRVILHRDLLDRAHILQPGALARFEEEVDQRRMRAAVRHAVLKGLAIPPAFGMPFEREQLNDVLGVQETTPLPIRRHVQRAGADAQRSAE
mgnify:CR=1 FL=1